jgi:thiamine kinase-like enzyme
MILTKNNLIHYLLDKDLIDPEKLITGEYTVRNNDSRNSNLSVNKEYNHHNYFIKQIKATEPEKIETIRTEAACYRLTANKNSHIALREFLPEFYLFDKRNHILVTEQIRDVMSLHEFYFAKNEFQNEIPEKLAEVLSNLHKKEVLQSLESVPETDKLKFKNQKPWVFTLTDRPLAYWAAQPPSAEQQAMMIILKNTDFAKKIAETNLLWQPGALLHHDIKFTNFLIRTGPDGQKIDFVKLIDWELADYGDPAWDLACLIQSYLHLWAATDIPEEELKLQGNLQKVSLQTVQACIMQVWRSYVQAARIPATLHPVWLLKLVKFTALKLVHTCFETTPYAQTLQPNGVKLLQIAYNILKSPENAITHLLGIK